MSAAVIGFWVCGPRSGLAAARPETPQVEVMPEVEVTGSVSTGSPLSPDLPTAKSRLQQLPGAAEVVSAERFTRSRGAYLEDFLPYTPGLFIQSSQGSEDTKISIRGSGVQSDNILGVNLLIDGLPVNQADGEAFLEDLDLRSVKYTEVYRGADALRYGSTTLGGAINFVTLTGYGAPPLQAWITAGSYGLLDGGASSGWNHRGFDGFATFSAHTVDGFREHSQENTEKIFLSLGYQINEDTENRFYLFGGRLRRNNPSSLTKQQMLSDPTQTDPQSIRQNWATEWEYFRLIDRFSIKGDDWRLQIGGYYNHRDELQRREFDDDTPEGTTHFYSDDLGGDLAFESNRELFGQRNRLTVGVNAGFESEPDTNYANLDGRIGPLIAADRTSSINAVLYLENQHYLTGALSFLTGFQAIYVQRMYRDRLNSRVDGNQSNTEDFRGLNPKAGLLYEWSKEGVVYLNVSRSFQAPSFDEEVETADNGNQLFNRLDAQTAVTLEAGTRGAAGPFTWDVAIYRSWLRNELLDLTNGRGVAIGTVNVPRTIHQGIEAEAEVELAHALLARGGAKEDADRLVLEQSYTLSDFRFDDDPTYSRNRIAGAPVHFYKAELRYEHPCGFYCGPNVEWNAVKYPVDEANRLFADPYALLGFRIGYKNPRAFEVFFEAKNLTDKIYAATVEPVGNATVEGSSSFNPGNGRSFYGGISWKW